MEASALHQASLPALAGRSPLLRLQSDEKLVALVRRGHNGAFEALVQRYQPRLLAFCRHMLGSQEDAEDVLQEVFAASYNALLADDRPINARPWLYRIARNRCLNHLRKPSAAGQDSMDIFERDNGTTTAETVHGREEFRQIVSDVGELPETQRTALLLREIDALSYDQIAEAMDTTIPSVKSLLVRARVSLAEAAEARLLTCEEARLELGRVAEGLATHHAPRPPAPQGLRPLPPLPHRAEEHHQGARGDLPDRPARDPEARPRQARPRRRRRGRHRRARPAQASPARRRGRRRSGHRRRRRWSRLGHRWARALGTLASKAAAGMAAAVIVTAGAVEVKQVTKREPGRPPWSLPWLRAPPPRRRCRPSARRSRSRSAPAEEAAAKRSRRASRVAKRVEPPAKPPAPVDVPATPAVARYRCRPVQEEESTTVLPPRTEPLPTPEVGAPHASARRDRRHAPRAARRPRLVVLPPRRRADPRRCRASAATAASSRLGRAAVATIEDFDRIDMRVGRIVSVEDFPEARKPAWKLEMDFGPEIGTKRSSAQITNYAREELEGRLVVAVVNFPPRQIGPVRSEVLVLGAPDEEGRIILLRPDADVPLGGRIF